MPRPRRRRFARGALRSRAGPRTDRLRAPPARSTGRCPQLRKRLPYPGPALGLQLPTPDAGRSKRPPGHGGPLALRPVPTRTKGALDEFSADPDRRGEREHAYLPRGATRGGWLRGRARRQPPARARAPRQPPARTGVGGHQRAHARSARRRPRRRGAGRRDRPVHADDRAHLAGGRARPGASVRARRG